MYEFGLGSIAAASPFEGYLSRYRLYVRVSIVELAILNLQRRKAKQALLSLSGVAFNILLGASFRFFCTNLNWGQLQAGNRCHLPPYHISLSVPINLHQDYANRISKPPSFFVITAVGGEVIRSENLHKLCP